MLAGGSVPVAAYAGLTYYGLMGPPVAQHRGKGLPIG